LIKYTDAGVEDITVRR